MASNSTDPSATEDDDYQAPYDDEEDDEQTIEEEEQLNSDNDEDNELDDLQADADMPLEELLKLYGQNAPVNHIPHDVEDDEDEKLNSAAEETQKNIYRPQFHHLLQVHGQLLHDEDDDSDDSFEPEIIKVINVGEEYQAQVDLQTTNGFSDDREVPVDELFWSPSTLSDENIDEYLLTIRGEFPQSNDELSLQTLLKCQMNAESALIQFRQLPVKTVYPYRQWSLDESQQFEKGLREFGKNFFQISVSKLPNRSVREIVHYYYQWKKTEQYQIYLDEQQRLSAITSVTDMIERLIEEQEEQLCTAVNVINASNPSSILSNDLKQNSSISFVTTTTTTSTITNKRSFDQVENEAEPPAKKSSLNATATIG